MKRSISILLCSAFLIFAALPFFGCAKKAESERFNIVCTTFPQYDWIKNIIKDSDTIELTLLIRNGTDPHSYQPTAADIMALSNADMIVSVGGDSEKWVDEAIERAQNESSTIIKLTQIAGMTLHEISSSSHSHDDGHEHEHEHAAFDEHVWLSVKNAITATEYLAREISKKDSDNSSKYTANAAEYVTQLMVLDADFTLVTNQSQEENRFMLFADRFPFVYLLSDYGIEYAAAFEGCTADAEANFDTVIDLIREADEHSVKYIAVTESSDRALAKTVAQSAKRDGIKIITLNSLQNVSEKSIKSGGSYISIMQENLASVKLVLQS